MHSHNFGKAATLEGISNLALAILVEGGKELAVVVEHLALFQSFGEKVGFVLDFDFDDLLFLLLDRWLSVEEFVIFFDIKWLYFHFFGGALHDNMYNKY